jgi:CRP-like cAMP-binding protein
MGPQNVFGEEEIIDDIPRLNTAIVVSSSVELYCISREKFNYFLRRSTACTKMIDQLETKKQYREKYKVNLTETAKHQSKHFSSS